MRNKLILIGVLFTFEAISAELRPIVLDQTYEHTKWGIEPTSTHLFKFAAFTSSFDGKDDNDSDGDEDKWGIPEWVAFEIKGPPVNDEPDAPSKWITDDTLFGQGLAPNHETYKVSKTNQLKIVSSSYRFVRGHMCPKATAKRISKDAAYNTHTVLNAVPQLQWQNNGIWKRLENECMKWANKYGRVWVVCGPVFFEKSPALWLGQDGENRAAVPDALFKIVIREESNGDVKALAFTIPNILPKTERDFWDFQTTIEDVQQDTDLDFLTELSEEKQLEIEGSKGSKSDWKLSN